MHSPRQPFNDLPRLPPVKDLETKSVLKSCIASREALVELRLSGRLIPNPLVLVNAIPRLEARDSSAIENIVTTNDALFRAATINRADVDPVTKEVARYAEAIFHGVEALRRRALTVRTAVDICRIVTGIDIDIRALPGTTLSNPATGEVIYTPPEGKERIRALLADWETYIHAADEIDPVLRMAVQHYQFEAIHPFLDGNGRTGRILNILLLIEAGLLDQPTLYLSRSILRSRADYYRLLGRVTTHGEWEPWVLYMLAAVTSAAKWTTARIEAIRKLMDETRDHIRAELPKIYSHELVEVIFTQPYCRISDLAERGIAKRQAASTYLKDLRDIDVLDEEKVGRDKIFIHRRYLALLNSEEPVFAPYAKRNKV